MKPVEIIAQLAGKLRQLDTKYTGACSDNRILAELLDHEKEENAKLRAEMGKLLEEKYTNEKIVAIKAIQGESVKANTFFFFVFGAGMLLVALLFFIMMMPLKYTL